jgi:FkbM family methyltransferase
LKERGCQPQWKDQQWCEKLFWFESALGIANTGGRLIKQLNRKYKVVFTLKNLVADVFCKVFLLSIPNKWSVVVSDRFNRMFYVIHENSKKFKLLSNTELLLYRSKTFHTKEPETNRWIKTIPKDGVFYDVGANVGVFTILASAYCRKVYAFEPVALNYSVLNQNIMVNMLDQVAVAYCMAISDTASFDTIRLSSNVIGSAHHSFGANNDACHNEYTPVFKQGCFGVSLDELVYKYGFDCPTFLKVDVDGNEHLVIGGAARLLRDPHLKSVLIELNKDLKIDQVLVKTIQGNGFTLVEVGEEATLNGMKIGNLIFFRST